MAHDVAAHPFDPPAAATAAVHCDTCGDSPPDGAVPLTWIRSIEGSGSAAVARFTCDACSREHLRSIESKLDSPWW